MPDDFESLIERRTEDESRIHTDLTDRFRERLLHILTAVEPDHKKETFNILFERRGYTEIQEAIYPEADSWDEVIQLVDRMLDQAESRIVLNADTILTLSYIEYVLKFKDSQYSRRSRTSRINTVSPNEVATKIARALESEGILWELSKDSDGNPRFKEMGTEMMQEADDELRSLALGDPWKGPLKGYNEAYKLYLDRKYGKEIPEKLYNSIEDVIKTICVDLEGWEDSRERNLKNYLDILRDKEVFAPNPIMKAEIGDLVDSMEKTFSKAGNDRKNRHELIDRRYCTLLLHQVSAYLVFIIKRYEDEYGSS